MAGHEPPSAMLPSRSQALRLDHAVSGSFATQTPRLAFVNATIDNCKCLLGNRQDLQDARKLLMVVPLASNGRGRVGEYPRAEESPEQFHSTDRDNAQMAFWSWRSWPSAGWDEKRDKHSSDLAGAVVFLLATHKKWKCREVLNVRGLGLAFDWPWPASAETSKSLKE